ncbi:MAG TPA: hypothetical protein VGP43_04705 [Chitinophagaceae bacterium]|nr:hypothetical protein [Chitinophagaceae bacterium]
MLAAIEKKNNIWQLEIAATKASSGSTADASDIGVGTTCGEEDAGIFVPPSNAHVCFRLYLLSVKDSVSLPLGFVPPIEFI